MTLAAGMKQPTKEKVEEVLRNIATLANGLRHLPFCELRPNGAHEFGLRFNFISKLNNVFNSKDQKNKDQENEKIERL